MSSNSHQPDDKQPPSTTPPVDPALPWYHEGLRFECTQCGDCCTGAPGYVWVTPEEIESMAAAAGVTDLDEFRRLYVRQVGARQSLRERANGDCVFLDSQTRGCQVYAARPRQCRTWPFWDSNLKSKQAWRRTCEVCPGSGQGKLHSLETIEAQRKVMKI